MCERMRCSCRKRIGEDGAEKSVGPSELVVFVAN